MAQIFTGSRVVARINDSVTNNTRGDAKSQAKIAVKRIDGKVKAADNWSQLTSEQQTAVTNARASALTQWPDLLD